MGGTFDPIHLGHLAAANEAQHRLGLDEVVFVPSGEPWQKAHRSVSPADDRWDMVAAAIAGNPRFGASRVEVDRPGPTYTVDTLRELRAQHPVDDLFFITGADALAQILGWHRADELFALAHFLGVTRPGYSLELIEGLPADGVTLLEVPALAISSSDLRARVARGAPVRYLVPDRVETLIAERGLYRTGA